MRAAQFWGQVVKTDGCWLWSGKIDKGYGRYNGRGAHRVAYELTVGPIPSGLEIDHVCRTPLCVRPDHLEPVTRLENMRRRYATYTACINGHQYDEANTYIMPRGYRDCRACIRERARRYRLRSAETAAGAVA